MLSSDYIAKAFMNDELKLDAVSIKEIELMTSVRDESCYDYCCTHSSGLLIVIGNSCVLN